VSHPLPFDADGTQDHGYGNADVDADTDADADTFSRRFPFSLISSLPPIHQGALGFFASRLHDTHHWCKLWW